MRPQDSGWQSVTDTYTAINGVNAGTVGSVTKTKAITGLTKGGSIKAYAEAWDVAGNKVTSYTAGNPLSFTTTVYTISYNANLGGGAPGAQTKYYGVNISLSSVVPTRTGYTFQGWSASSSATSATWGKGGTYANNESKTLYAVWKDTIKPSIISLTPNTTATVNSVTLTGKAQDTGSGIVAYAWTTTASVPTSWTAITGTTGQISQATTLTGNGTRYFWVKDAAGNVNNAGYTVSNIVAKVSNARIIGTNVLVGNSGSVTASCSGTPKSRSFTSSNTNIVTVNASTGAVTGKVAGTATITVTYSNYDGTTASAACTVTVNNGIAAVGGVHYTSITGAIGAISSSGTVTMIQNRTESPTVPAGKTITLALNGKTITGTIYNSGNLTINGAGTIQSSDRAISSSAGEVRINGGTLTSNTNTCTIQAIGTKLHLNGGTIVNNGGGNAVYVDRSWS